MNTHETGCTNGTQGNRSTESGQNTQTNLRDELTKFQLRQLATLATTDRYGIGIQRELEEYYQRDLNHGQNYPNLDQLVEHGLVKKSQRDRRTNNYSITSKGEAVLEDELDWLEAQINGGDTPEGATDEDVEEALGGRSQ